LSIAAVEEAQVTPAGQALTPPRTHLGVLVDVGFPDGAGLSVAYRPYHWLRFQAGAMNNIVGTGIRAGVSLIPFYFWISPALTLEGGHFFPGDVTWLARRVLHRPDLSSPLLQHIGYNFGSAQIGIELGSPRRIAFSLRAGISYLKTTGPKPEEINDPNITAKDLSFERLLPSAKLGLTIYFL
jgi:hypothetical protein